MYFPYTYTHLYGLALAHRALGNVAKKLLLPGKDFQRHSSPQTTRLASLKHNALLNEIKPTPSITLQQHILGAASCHAQDYAVQTHWLIDVVILKK